MRPYVPVWNYAKVPRVTLSPEENARLLCVYMRPWTLNPADMTEQTPLLSRLGIVRETSSSAATSSTCKTKDLLHTGSAQEKEEAHGKTAIAKEEAQSKHEDEGTRSIAENGVRKRRSTKTKQTTNFCNTTEVRSYAKAWLKYIDGNVVSRLNQRFITNLLTATAARVVEEPGDSSGDSDDFDYNRSGVSAGSMNLIKQTLDGIRVRDEDNGVEAIGRHATILQLGRNLWQSPPLSTGEASLVKEQFFDDGSFPPAEEALQAAREAIKNEEDRPAPFDGRTTASAQYSKFDYEKMLNEWFALLQDEREPPNTKQLAVLQAVRDRILQEIRLSREGPGLWKRLRTTSTADPREEPLRGLCHGFPGTGKSRVIKWMIRMFTEALNWQHGVEFQCVAFQNTVAYAMGGLTLHSSGDIQIGGASGSRKLEHSDIDLLFSRNQSLRWLLFDGVFMIQMSFLGFCRSLARCRRRKFTLY